MLSTQQLRKQLERKRGQKAQLSKELELAKSKVEYYKREVKISEEAQLVIQQVAKETQQEIEYQLSELITLSMEAILDEPYKFIVKFEIRRGKTECDLYFLKNKELYDPMEEGAGGVIDIAAFALQIALLRISFPKLRNILITDEPFKHLSKDLHRKAGIVLKELSNRLKPKLQIIMITHSKDLTESADKVFITKRTKGYSTIKEVKNARDNNIFSRRKIKRRS